MTDRLEFETWDVFTDRRFAGNPLAIVFDADRLDSDTMLAIAREFDYSESVFVGSPASAAADARLRIFTPGGELPFAGHPTDGAACAIARRRDNPARLVLDLEAGRFPVALVARGDGASAAFDNPNLPRVAGDGPDAAAIEAALGLPYGSVDRHAHRPRRVGAGIDFVYASAPLAAVQGARLDTTAWRRLGIDQECGLLLYAPVAADPGDAAWQVRMFAPHIGVAEDPATGSAAAALPGQILAAGGIGDGRHQWSIAQGVEMGRPSRIEVRFEVAGGAITGVSVGGSAVAVMAGTIRAGT